MPAQPTLRSTAIALTTLAHTSTARAISARPGRESTTAFPTERTSAPCAKIRVKKGLLFAGTELGVFFSINDGDTWQPLQLNLPVSPVHDLVIKDNDLVVATHGRAFWILDDISPLRQLTAEVQSASAHLFVPSTCHAYPRQHSRRYAFAAGRACGRKSAARSNLLLLLEVARSR